MNPYFQPGAEFPEIEIRTEAEADELWSYTGHKGSQRWTWYAGERSSGVYPHGTTEDGRMKAAPG